MEEKKIIKPHETISFADLINLSTWKRIQDNFSTITNIHIATLDPKGLPVIPPSEEPRLCCELLRHSPFRNEICNLCLPTFLGGKGIVDKNLGFTCIANLHNFIVPLQINNLIIGFILLGPLHFVRLKPKEEYARQAEELHLDLEEFWQALAEIKIISFHAAHCLTALIKDVGEYILNLSYQNLLRAKKAALTEAPKLNELLNTLLDSACQISKANIGSIMLLDKKKSELRIHTARGLSNEIIKNTRINFGEGISGTAAKEGKLLILDDNIKNNRIKCYMRRPQINTSVVLPIKVENNVLGIMSLCTLKSSPAQLDINSVPLIDKLTNIAASFLQE